MIKHVQLFLSVRSRLNSNFLTSRNCHPVYFSISKLYELWLVIGTFLWNLFDAACLLQYHPFHLKLLENIMVQNSLIWITIMFLLFFLYLDVFLFLVRIKGFYLQLSLVVEHQLSWPEIPYRWMNELLEEGLQYQGAARKKRSPFHLCSTQCYNTALYFFLLC